MVLNRHPDPARAAAHVRAALARQTEEGGGDPLCAYLYDLPALREHAAGVAAALPPGCELFYAVKANAELPILHTLAPLVAGFEVSSGGELAWVRQHFPERPVIFSGPGKLDSELGAALAQQVECVHVESLHEIDRLAALAARRGVTQDVLLRVNLALDALAPTRLMMGGRPTPFGVPSAALPAGLARLRDYPQLRLRGFHFHLLSHQLDAQAHLAMIAACLRQVRAWCEAYRLDVGQVNVGGGIGVNYTDPAAQFDWNGFCAGLSGVLQSDGMPGVTLRFEMGRFISAWCGWYAAQVIDVKDSYGKTFVVVRGGTHHFRTPQAQGLSHPFHVLPVDAWPYAWPRPQAGDGPVTVVGQLCTPKDVLAFDAPVARVRCGDVLLFPLAGAYAWHISHHDFLRHPHPQQWYLPLEDDHAAG
ncbi:siderophore biosynthesis PLP-dependent protein [Duganella sp. FT92W]|uniref:Siderophore biosynthesis PLP-dependent protein n=1 Tax=Pseudoduganella rivuli TaxID=2666085 RepID=A0A7X2IR00_9BURK|nr:type III PLP-dependent enzyme [Pseudoduganella rivuli]MRV74389.1 siderophore biosynthesis PLP-dependent protein [Pseudoduganella rivuli]